MANTVLRLGLWILILVLAAYVIELTYETELISMQLILQALTLGGVLIIAGIVLRILGVGVKVVAKNRCRVCRTAIPPGAMYCRAHLRSILQDEEDKTHSTRARR